MKLHYYSYKYLPATWQIACTCQFCLVIRLEPCFERPSIDQHHNILSVFH